MSICVFYIDEAGSKERYSIPIRPDMGETAIFCLFALALPLADWRDFDRDYLQLKRDFFAKEISESKHRAEYWEVKGNELCSPHNKDSHRRHAFLRKVFDLCNHYEAVAFAVTFLKNHVSPMPAEARYCMGFQFLAERFNTFLAESNTYDHGILIADSRMKSLDFNVGVSYLSYVFGHETGRLLTRLIESPLFANSRLSAGLQIADNIAGALFANYYDYYCSNIPGAPDYSHIPPQYWPRLDGLQFKSKKRYDGYIMYGFKVCDHQREPLTIHC
ncbi:MAG: DUF3800 domain-containing protein [Anaerolineales bacterium]|nr:DUF3800 domain-containing protein [Anaerolineales bacterium]